MLLLFSAILQAAEIQLVSKDAHYFNSFKYINRIMDKKYGDDSKSIKMPIVQPSVEILIGKFDGTHLLGFELDKNSGSWRKETLYHFPPEFGIPDPKDIHGREHNLYNLLLNNYFAVYRGKHHRLSLCLGAGLGYYHYKEYFDIQLAENDHSVLKSTRNGVVPIAKIALTNEWRIKNHGIILIEGGVKSGFFIAAGLGIRFSNL